MRLTKLQTEFIDKFTEKDGYIAFPINVFKSKEYKEWKREKRQKNK